MSRSCAGTSRVSSRCPGVGVGRRSHSWAMASSLDLSPPRRLRLLEVSRLRRLQPAQSDGHGPDTPLPAEAGGLPLPQAGSTLTLRNPSQRHSPGVRRSKGSHLPPGLRRAGAGPRDLLSPANSPLLNSGISWRMWTCTRSSALRYNHGQGPGSGRGDRA